MESCPAFPCERHGLGRVSPDPRSPRPGPSPSLRDDYRISFGALQAETRAHLGLTKLARRLMAFSLRKPV
jgi:hypothetical protein